MCERSLLQCWWSMQWCRKSGSMQQQTWRSCRLCCSCTRSRQLSMPPAARTHRRSMVSRPARKRLPATNLNCPAHAGASLHAGSALAFPVFFAELCEAPALADRRAGRIVAAGAPAVADADELCASLAPPASSAPEPGLPTVSFPPARCLAFFRLCQRNTGSSRERTNGKRRGMARKMGESETRSTGCW